MLVVTAGDFSVRASNSLNEVAARYDLFGGPSAVVLTAKDPTFEFPDLMLSDYGLAARIADSVEHRLHSEFPECGRALMRLTLNEHLNVLEPENADGHLSRYAIPSAKGAFGDMPGVHQHGAIASSLVGFTSMLEPLACHAQDRFLVGEIAHPRGRDPGEGIRFFADPESVVLGLNEEAYVEVNVGRLVATGRNPVHIDVEDGVVERSHVEAGFLVRFP